MKYILKILECRGFTYWGLTHIAMQPDGPHSQPCDVKFERMQGSSPRHDAHHNHVHMSCLTPLCGRCACLCIEVMNCRSNSGAAMACRHNAVKGSQHCWFTLQVYLKSSGSAELSDHGLNLLQAEAGRQLVLLDAVVRPQLQVQIPRGRSACWAGHELGCLCMHHRA